MMHRNAFVNATLFSSVVLAICLVASSCLALTSAADDSTVCQLLSSQDIESTQNSILRKLNPKQFVQNGFRISLCVFQTSDISKSLQLSIIESDPDDPQKHDVHNLWEVMFRKKRNRDKKETGTKKRETESDEDDDEGGLAIKDSTRIRKIGDDAYWSTSQYGGALFILRGDRIFRVSIGGAEPLSVKLSKSKVLGFAALTRAKL